MGRHKQLNSTLSKKLDNDAMDLFKQIIKDVGDHDTHIADEAESAGEFTGGIDTGSYLFNAAVSGSLFGGVPNNKITAFAGVEACGKTFFVLGLVKKFLDDVPSAAVFYYDSESAVTKQMLVDRGVDAKRVIIVEPETIQAFRTHVLKVLDNYAKVPEDERPPMLIVLDSLGQLSTTKEVTDIAEGKETKDMTRPGIIRGAFRVMTLKLAKLKVPMLVTNHTYDVIGCLSDKSNIIMADSSVKNISDVKVNDVVMTMVGPKKVTELYQYRSVMTIDIKFEDGTVIQATPNHKFLTTENVWKCADELCVTDELSVFSLQPA
jgi:RecA/RadA recombinase